MGLAPVFWGRSYSPRMLNVSISGLDFIFQLEAGAGTGKSERIHFPGGDSGVTLGPGYDMRERKVTEVERDLTVIGVDPAIAKTLSNGVKLHGELQVKPFVNAYKHVLKLSMAQQKQLLKIVMPKYEDIVRRLITIDLFQFEYDALVSIAYNPGGSLVLFAQHINSGEPEKAMKIIASRIHSGGQALPGLLSRRKKEIALYTHSIYC
jgi:GH24 family phage-related lysozyme (muramidase)